MRDRLKYLASTETRLAKEETLYAENVRRRDSHTRTITEKGKEKILVELTVDGKTFTARDSDKIRDRLLDGIKEVTRDSSAKVLFGSYRGFEVFVERSRRAGGKDGFQLSLLGAEEREFRPGNLFYDFEENLSLAGLFQRIDNFLAKGLDESITTQRENARQEKAELETVRAALGKEFPQQEELVLARENHNSVIRELQRMQDDASYVSTWTPKTSLTDEQPTTTAAPPKEDCTAIAPPVTLPEKRLHTLKYGEGEGRSEYTVSNQHNGHTLKEGYVLRRTYFNSHVGSLGSRLYEDGKWHSTTTAPQGVKLRLFASLEEGLAAAREDAARRGLKETPPAETATVQSAERISSSSDASQSYHDRLVGAGFSASGLDFYGKHEHTLKLDAEDDEMYELRVFQTGNGKIGLRVQYEKNHIINGARTVRASFDTLAEALEHVEAYRQLTAPQAKAAAQTASPSGGVHGFVISSPRLR